MKTASSRRFRLSLFASLYVVQGIGLAYFHNFQKPYLDGLGVSPNVIGLLTLVLQLPFVLKIFIGVLSDRVNLFGLGHRKPYMVIGLVLAAIAFSTVTVVSPAHRLLAFSILVTLGSFAVTLFDSTTDGLAIDTTPHEERGAVQGTMVAGRAVAFILLSLVFGYLVRRYGYAFVFPVIGISMLLPLIWVFRVREPQHTSENRFTWTAFKSLGQPLFLWFAVYAIVYSIGSFGTDGLVTYYMSEVFDASEEAIGQYGALRGVGAVIGAIVGGLLLTRVARKRCAYAATILISLGGIALAVASGLRGVMAMGLVWGVVWAFQETVFFALAMDVANIRIAASMFAIMMGISNLGSAVADGLATALSDDFGFRNVLVGLAIINLITLLVLWRWFRISVHDDAPGMVSSDGVISP